MIDDNEVELPAPEQSDVVEHDDGSADIYIPSNESASSLDGDFFENLADTLPDDVLSSLAEKYLDLIESDMEAREERDKMQADALNKSGISEPASGGADFEGASRVTHPLLAEAYIDFSASAIKELFPPNGPIKTKIDGKVNKEKSDKAKRKAEFMNWQICYEITSYRSELEKLLTQLPIGGSQYMKVFWDGNKGRPEVEFVPIDDLVLPYEARNFYEVQRKFHKMIVDATTYDNRVNSGVYRDLSRSISSDSMTKSKSQMATDKIEGKRDNHNGVVDEYLIFEGCIQEEIDNDFKAPKNKLCPYLITIDSQSREVLSIYRNWAEDDKYCQEIQYIVDFNFIPWRGVYGLSLLQCLGGLPDALTGSLRALMDSALISNMPGGIKLKGGTSSSTSYNPTQWTEIDLMGQDDIRKAMMPMSMANPSPVLFQLLGFITQAAQGVVGTAEEKIADASNNMPVGTTLALIEQGAKVFSSIHARLHDSQRRILEIIHRLNRDHLPDKLQFGEDVEDYVGKADFEGIMDVHPVSDPNIFSESQRFAQIQFVLQLITQMAAVAPQTLQLYNMRELFARAFELIKIPEYEDFLPPVPIVKLLNPADENVKLVLGEPVKAYSGQNHEAHVKVLLDFAQNPLFGASPIIAQKFIPAALNHLQDHILVWYSDLMKLDVSKGDKNMDFDNNPQVAVEMAKTCEVVDKAAEIAFGKVEQVITMAMQKMQSLMPKPPVDPMVQIAQGQLTIAQQKAASDAQNKMQILQQKAQQAQSDLQFELQKAGIQAQTETQMAELQSQTSLAQTLHDNHSAQQIAAMKIAADAHTRLSTGASLE